MAKGTEIPTRARRAVSARSGDACERCGGRAAQIHHRQRRREGGHGLSNLVHLCYTCHRQVHAEPDRARAEGFIVTVATPRDQIAAQPLRTIWGNRLLNEDGTYGEGNNQ